MTIKFIICVVAALVGKGTAHAQTAVVAGHVIDEQGAALVGAAVTLSGQHVAPLVSITDGTGDYQFDGLTAGSYTLVVELAGFRTERRSNIDIGATVGMTIAIDIRLILAPFRQEVDVVAVMPLLEGGVSREKIPATVHVLDSSDLADRRSPSLAGALYEGLGSVTVEEATTNPLQPNLRFRGFTASPVLGLPQGVAVFQNGVRINEPFGDTVNFDLIPQFAIDRAQLSAGAEPTYGLNALGGVLALRLKNGFNHSGFSGELLGGSFGRFSGTSEFGSSHGPWGFYVGATRFDEVGWRQQSPSEVTQFVTDVAYHAGRVDAGVSFTYADSSLYGNGSAPIELLAVDRSALFTYPDTTTNRLAFTQGRFNLAMSPTWSVQLTGYYRNLDQKTINGDEAEFVVCQDDARPFGAPDTTLCFASGGDDDDGVGGEDAESLVDVRTGRFITTNDTEGSGAFNRTATLAQGYGVAIQAQANTVIRGHENVLSLGVSVDLADVAFSSNSEVGTLTPERTVAGSGLFAGIFGKAPDDRFNTGLDTENRFVGVYFSNTLSVTDRLHLTASGRFNQAQLDIIDRLGTSLNGAHSFSRFNVSGGGVYELTDVTSVFGRYAESNRAPTAVELSCADPDEPCRVPNAFISDPPLEQAVARSVEGGVRGRVRSGAVARIDWSATVYRTGIVDDILFVASPELIGTGFFQNAGDTRHAGLDLDLAGQVSRVGWFVSYGLVQATFESKLELPSNEGINDAATESGTIAVEPGDRLPSIPRHSFSVGLRYGISDDWDIDFGVVATSSRVFVGDEGNDQTMLDGYGVVNLRSAYRISRHLELFVRVDNLFDEIYSTFGALAEVEVFLREAPNATDPRFLGPSPPRSAFTGLRVTF